MALSGPGGFRPEPGFEAEKDPKARGVRPREKPHEIPVFWVTLGLTHAQQVFQIAHENGSPKLWTGDSCRVYTKFQGHFTSV